MDNGLVWNVGGARRIKLLPTAFVRFVFQKVQTVLDVAQRSVNVKNVQWAHGVAPNLRGLLGGIGAKESGW